jgi:hypothetical protein
MPAHQRFDEIKISLSSENDGNSLRQNAINHMSVDIRKPPPDTVVVERQPCMIDAC